MTTSFNPNERDLLIRLDTKVDNLIDAVNESKNGHKQILEDHETRIRFIEKYMWMAIGIVVLIEFAITILSNHGIAL